MRNAKNPARSYLNQAYLHMHLTCRARTGSSSAIRVRPGPHHHVVSPQHQRRGRRSTRCSGGLSAPRCTGHRGPLHPWSGCAEAASAAASASSRQAGAQVTVEKDARSERLEAPSTRARSGRHSVVRAGGELAPAFSQNERSRTSRSGHLCDHADADRRRGRTAPLGGRMAARIARDEGLCRSPTPRRLWQVATAGVRAVRRLSRAPWSMAPITSGVESVVPLRLRLHSQLTTDHFDSADLGPCRPPAERPTLTAGASWEARSARLHMRKNRPTHLHQRTLLR
jgi:hypothetical protein